MKSKHGHCSSMLNSAETALKSSATVTKRHDLCPNRKLNCHEQTEINTKQFEGGLKGFTTKLKKN